MSLILKSGQFNTLLNFKVTRNIFKLECFNWLWTITSKNDFQVEIKAKDCLHMAIKNKRPNIFDYLKDWLSIFICCNKIMALQKFCESKR